MGGKFNHIKIPPQWKPYWDTYPEGYTILEALIEWVSQVNKMVDNVNDLNKYLKEFIETFDESLQSTVAEHLTKWYEDGVLAELINEDLLEFKLDTTAFEEFKRDIGEYIENHKDNEIIHREIFFDNAPNPDLYDDGDIVLREGFPGIHSRGFEPITVVSPTEVHGGWWVRFEDGTQICWAAIPHQVPQTTPTGALFRTAEATEWHFPRQFLANSGFAFFDTASTYRWAQKMTMAHSTRASYHIIRPVASDFGGTIHGFAIGIWR